MSDHPTTFTGDIPTAIRAAITGALPDAVIEVVGGSGHWTLTVTSQAFADKGMLQRHRLVLAAIAPLMAGGSPPVHAVDKLTTLVPD